MTYRGDLDVEAIHTPSGTHLIADAPVDNQGKGSSFSPTDLVATALGSCMAITMGIVAKRHQIDLTGMKTSVEKEMTSQPTRRIGSLKVVITGPAGIKKSDQELLERAALGCPVHKSLHPEVQIPVTFLWG